MSRAVQPALNVMEVGRTGVAGYVTEDEIANLPIMILLQAGGAAIVNARASMQVQEEHDSSDRYVWRFVDGRSRQKVWCSLEEVPPSRPSRAGMSRDLKRRSSRFVGPTIYYAFRLAPGLVNDHPVEPLPPRGAGAIARCAVWRRRPGSTSELTYVNISV